MGKLDGKIAVITGGASGIGAASVRLFVGQGAKVIIVDIRDDKGKSLAEELGPNAIYLHGDVRREADVKGAVDEALKRFQRLDCMFNNAGSAGFMGPIEETPVEAFDDIISVLLRGVFLGMKHAAPVMKKQGYGSIISTASVAGLGTGFGPHAYSAAKAAVIHLTRSVAMELAESGVRVNCICPGGIATGIFGGAFGLPPEDADQTIDIVKEQFKDLHPIKRCGLPEDIAHAALWLASEDSCFVNGHALVVDGGLTGGMKWSDSVKLTTDLAVAMGLPVG